MALSKNEMQKYAVFGAIMGAALPFIMKAVVPLLDKLAEFIPGFTATLAAGGDAGTISISLRENIMIGLQNSAIGQYIFGLTPFNAPQTLILAAGGAVVVLGGAWIADMIGQLKGNKRQRLTTVLFIGTLAAAFVTGLVPSISLGFLNLVVHFAVNALFLGWLISLIDEQAKLGLVP